VVDFFFANPEAQFVFGDCNFINEQGELTGRFQTRDFDLDEIINDACYIPAPAAFYRRGVVEKVGNWDTTLKSSDVDYWIRAGKVFPVHRINKVLANFRGHREKRGSAAMDRNDYFRESYIISRRHGGRFFSRRARRYYLSLLTQPLRPTLLFLYYPVLAKIVEFLRPVLGFSYPFFRNLLIKLTIIRPGE
jgi:hypothetical protein